MASPHLSPLELQSEAIAISKKYRKWSELSKEEQSLLQQYAKQQNSADPEALFYSLQQFTEEAESDLKSVVQGDLIKTLTEEYRLHKASLATDVKRNYPNASATQIDLMVKIILLQQIERNRQFQLSLSDRSTVTEAIESSDPKHDPIEAITQEAERLIETAQVSTALIPSHHQGSITLTPQQKEAATRTLIAANLVDQVLETPPSPDSLSENLQLSLAASPNYHSPIADTARQIEAATKPATEEQIVEYLLQAQSQLASQFIPTASLSDLSREHSELYVYDKETGQEIDAELLPPERIDSKSTPKTKEPITIDSTARVVTEDQSTALVPTRPSPRAWNTVTGEPIEVEEIEDLPSSAQSSDPISRPSIISPIQTEESGSATSLVTEDQSPRRSLFQRPTIPTGSPISSPPDSTPRLSGETTTTSLPGTTPTSTQANFTQAQINQNLQLINNISREGDPDYLSFLLTSNPNVRSAARSQTESQPAVISDPTLVNQLVVAASRELKLANLNNTASPTASAAASLAQSDPNTAGNAAAILAYSQVGTNNLTKILAHASQNVNNPNSELGGILRQHPTEMIALAHDVASVQATPLGKSIAAESRVEPSYYDVRYGHQLQRSRIINPTTGTAVYLNRIDLPPSVDIEQYNHRLNEILIAHDPDINDRFVSLISRTSRVKIALETNPQILSLTEQGTIQVNDQLTNQLINAARKDLGLTEYRAFPTKTAAEAAAIFEGLDHPNLATATKLYGQLDPLTFSRILEHAAQHADDNKSELGKLLSEHPEQIAVLAQQYSRVHQSQLGKEIFQEHAPNIRGYVSTYQKLEGFFSKLPQYNLITKVPGYKSAQKFVGNIADRLTNNPLVSRLGQYANKIPVAGTYLNYVLHPGQAIQNYIARQIGQRIVNRFINVAGEALLRRVTNEAAKKAIETIMKQGLKQGVEFLAKQGLKRGIQLVAQGANVVPGLGIIIAVAIEVIDFILKKIKQGLDSAAVAIWGEKVKARDLIAVPILIITSSIGVTLGIAAGIMIFLYLFAFTTAPIIGSLAQIGPFEDRGGSYTSRDAVISDPADLTGIDECPSRPPVDPPYSGSGYITQKPHVGSHTSGWSITVGGTRFTSEGEAIDYGIPTNTRIYATHKGQAYYYPQGSNSPNSYGNWVAIIGVCTDPTNNQKYQFVTTYAHLRTGNLPPGGPTAVNKGELIGLSNNTGWSTGPHLHYELMGLGDIFRYL